MAGGGKLVQQAAIRGYMEQVEAARFARDRAIAAADALRVELARRDQRIADLEEERDHWRTMARAGSSQ